MTRLMPYASIVRLISEQGRTVLISSHLLADVERVADRIALLEDGKLRLVEELSSLKARFRRVEVTFSAGMQLVSYRVENLICTKADETGDAWRDPTDEEMKQHGLSDMEKVLNIGG